MLDPSNTWLPSVVHRQQLTSSCVKPTEGTEYLVTDTANPGVGGGRHMDFRYVLQVVGSGVPYILVIYVGDEPRLCWDLGVFHNRVIHRLT